MGGTAVNRYLFSPLYYPQNRWAIVRWWESRRPLYNLVVGGAGLVTLAAVYVTAGLPPLTDVRDVGRFVLVYAGVANLFYSFGAPIDLFLRRLLSDDAGPVAQALFRYGLAFAVGLTLIPIPLMALGWIISRFVR